MANKYRVDRALSSVTPCGMNSLLYIGDDLQQSINIYNDAYINIDTWSQPNNMYGVIWSVWSDQKQQYIVKRTKGINK